MGHEFISFATSSSTSDSVAQFVFLQNNFHLYIAVKVLTVSLMSSTLGVEVFRSIRDQLSLVFVFPLKQ